MTATAHALIAGAISASTNNIPLGLTLSAISHPLGDLVPHWDFGNNWRQKPKLTLFIESSLDLLAGVILAYLLFGQNANLAYFAGCIFLAEVWDMAEVPYWFFNLKIPPFSWIYNVQSRMQNRLKLPWGLISQIAAVTAIILLFQYIRPF